MAGEATTIARPYAEAIFGSAVAAGELEQWSEILGLLGEISADPQMAALIGGRQLHGESMTQLLLELGGKRLHEPARNFVKLLVENDRLTIIGDIGAMFEKLRSEHEGAVDVVIESPLAVDAVQEQALAAALKRRLGREVRVSSEPCPELIGGVRIRAGDLVIDGSVQGQLQKLAHQLGI